MFSFSKHLEYIRGSDIPDNHYLKTQIEIIFEVVVEFIQANNEQQKTLNKVQKTLNGVDNLLEKLCSGNGKRQSYTTSNNIYKRRKTTYTLQVNTTIKIMFMLNLVFQEVNNHNNR